MSLIEKEPRFKVGDRVAWTSGYTNKEGEIVAAAPAGTHPAAVGFPKLGDTAEPRQEESYVVRGGVRGQRQALYWPRVNALRQLGHLTDAEMAWCHERAERIRKMIAQES